MRIEAMNELIRAAGDKCEIAKVSYKDARRDYERLQLLLFILACVVAAFVVAGIVLVALGSDTRGAGIVSFVGSAVTGAGVGFVRGERDHARRARTAAERLVGDYCENGSAVMERLRSATAA